MCCIFNVFVMALELLQRLCVLMISCCVALVILGGLVLAVVAGIALGYNYSLSEFIELKETNVSVYLKRGIFEDEAGDQKTQSLRQGDESLVSSPPLDDYLKSPESGRRMENSLTNSLLQSNKQNSYEGHLMKLTATPPGATQSSTEMTADPRIAEILAKYPIGSPQQMKEMQNLLSMRKYMDNQNQNQMQLDQRYVPREPPSAADSARRMYKQLPEDIQGPTTSNSLRAAVPGPSINERAKWMSPYTNNKGGEFGDGDRDIVPTFPSPVTVREGPVRPTRPKSGRKAMKINENIIPSTSSKLEDVMDTRIKELDYLDDIRGFPIRAKRHQKIRTKESSGKTFDGKLVTASRKIIL